MSAVFAVTSDDPNNLTFGTCFIVDRHSNGDFFVITCAHVVRDVGGIERAMIGPKRPALVAEGSAAGIDLAVLRIRGLTGEPLPLGNTAYEDSSCVVKGFQQFGKQLVTKEVSGRLGRQTDLTSRGNTNRTRALDFIPSEGQIQPGYSGSPVLDASSGQVIGVASHTHGNGTRGLVIDIGNLDTVWKDDLRLKRLRADSAKNDADRSVAIRVSIEPWSRLVQQTPRLADQLLHGHQPGQDGSPCPALDQLLGALPANGLTIEVFSDTEKVIERVRNAEEFWVRVLSSVVLHANGSGPIKWLAKETIKVLGKDKAATTPGIVGHLWKHMCKRYCSQLSSHYEPTVLKRLTRAGIEQAGDRDRDVLYRLFSFFYECLDQDYASVRKVADHLAEYDEELGNNADPKFLETLKRLIGIGISTATHGIAEIPPFRPALAPIPTGLLCPYEFSAMVYPLTVYDYSSIRGVLPRNVGENPKFPYVFNIVSGNEKALFNVLASEVLSLVQLCNQFEPSEHLVWDVPTVCEWLALADCESEKYPWGGDQLTPQHANLAFDGSSSKLRPVGTCRLGASKHRTMDCCGNVHEIVRISQDDSFPVAFRLAGGCFQTSPATASCQNFREFKSKPQDDRRNVGLRLIRLDRADLPKRYSALKEYFASRKVADDAG